MQKFARIFQYTQMDTPYYKIFKQHVYQKRV